MPSRNFGEGSTYLPTYYAERVISYDDYSGAYSDDEEFESIDDFQDYMDKLLSEPGMLHESDYHDLDENIRAFNDSLEIFIINIEYGYYEGFQLVAEFIDGEDYFENEPSIEEAEWRGYDSVDEFKDAIAEEFIKLKTFLRELSKEYNLLK